MAARRNSASSVVREDDEEVESKSAQTKRRILDAAAAVLSAEGYAGLRLSDVATRAELQTPAIYYYFPSREDLIKEVMWVGTADVREHVAAALSALPEDTPALDRIMAAVDAHLRTGLEISDYTRAYLRNTGQVPLSIRKRQVAEEERYGEIWRHLITDLARAGVLRAELDPYIAQMLVLGALNWSVEWWDPRRISLDRVVADAQSLVRHGLT